MASHSKEYVRYWFLTIDSDVPDVDAKKVTEWITAVLADPRGWKSHGYAFQQVRVEEGRWSRSQPGMKKYVIHVHISTDDSIKQECAFGGLSCADMEENVIYFNRDRWLYGSIESNMDLANYRIYVINHEFGHLLNRKHNTCNDKQSELCPVMYQQTISTGCCQPNPWPLFWE
jgi:hypothetical protein